MKRHDFWSSILAVAMLLLAQNIVAADSRQLLPPLSVAVDEGISVANTATPSAVPAVHTLTIAVTGSGTTVPAPGSYSYPEGTVVQITAFPSEGWRLSNWNGKMERVSLSVSYNMNIDMTMTANFVPGRAWWVKSLNWPDDMADGTPQRPFRTIQKAVALASSGDAVIVGDGYYVENIDVSKSLILTAEYSDRPPFVIAADPADHILDVTANDVTIRGFLIYGTGLTSGKAGIRLSRVTGATVVGNRLGEGMGSLYYNDIGIEVYQGSNNMIIDNDVVGNDDGVLLEGSDGNMISGNHILSSRYYDLRLTYSSYPDGSDSNVIQNNELAFGGSTGIYVDLSNSNLIKGNVVHDKVGAPCIELHNSQTNTVYLNSFERDSMGSSVSSTGSPNNWQSPVVQTYIYQNQAFTGFLGNYYGGYAGLDNGANGRAAGDGVGDTAIPVVTDGTGDSYPLMAHAGYYRVGTVYTLTMAINMPAMGSILPTVGAHLYLSGAVINIAAPNPAPGYRFVNWSGDVSNVADVSVVYTTITMWDNASITANFAPILAGDENVDGVVNLVDLVRVAAAFGSAPGLPYWNSSADLDRNGVVDIFDLVTVGVNYGRSAG